MPPIYRLRAYLAARRDACAQCRKAPKQDRYEGFCSDACLAAAVEYQSY